MPRGPYWQSSLDMEGMGPWDGAIVPDYLAYKGDPLVFTTSVQLKIINERTGGRKPAKTANQGVVVVYMDRARGYTM